MSSFTAQKQRASPLSGSQSRPLFSVRYFVTVIHERFALTPKIEFQGSRLPLLS